MTNSINWDDPKSKISKYFTVKEALLLPSIKTLHIPSEEEKVNIVALAEKMDLVRELVGKAIVVHCWIRPTAVKCSDVQYLNFNYNEYSGSKAKKSAHIIGKAIDFHVSGSEGRNGCDYIRGLLLPNLEDWGLRMEDIAGDWIHLDTAPVISQRFFKP